MHEELGFMTAFRKSYIFTDFCQEIAASIS